MAKLFTPIRALRDSLQQIGAAVNASREYSRTADQANPASTGIPL